MMDSLRYLKTFFLASAAGLLLAALFNVVVDPYASFHWSDIRGFNDQKHLKRGGGRVNKGGILSRYSFDTLIFGTSRAELGLNPNSPVLGGAAAFNAAQVSTNLAEIRIEALFAAQHQTPSTVIIDLDFLTFTPKDELSSAADFPQSPFAGRSLIPILLERLVSWPSLVDCGTVIRNSKRHKRDPFTKFGYYDRDAVESSVRHREAFTVVMTTFMTGSNGYRGFDYRSERVEQLRTVIERFHAKGAKVVLYISPLHARHLEAMWELGLFPAFEQWKRDLTGLVARLRDENPGGAAIQLWDFFDYNSITTEPVGESMRWYWESSHYTSATGELILARMLGASGGSPSVPADFGTELTPNTIESVLANARTRHGVYSRDFPEELRDVRQLAEATAGHSSKRPTSNP
ncbi:hypothetical protein CU669_10875 [Paramagnetospirillum kuznetsovii]|uniref:Uncharacterized protein n=1 Tax=Paramagnetospirillum kuznetsovii TaxID=2053833 RepID=A0A364NXK2_9PROT|nr:hypothetical protein [Paramagnetospirillum kuznetsovii]RAU21802.1 hypothetical protein CU669_10875 [Paramagnetospirillum kuznetsovii]